MKKILKFIVLLTFVFILTACGNKTALTTNDMIEIMSNEGFAVSDVTKQIEDDRFKYVGSANNMKFQVEFYVFKELKDAKEAYKSNVTSFNATAKTKGKETTKENYSKYVQELSDKYNVVTRIDNTLIFSSVNIEYKSELKKVLRKLDY